MSVLDQAAALLQERDLCDDCLGRQFAKLGHGLSNGQRGHALRVSLCLQNNTTFIQTELCPLCLNQFDKVDHWAKLAFEQLSDYEFNTYLMGTRAPQFLSEAEEELREKHQLTQGEPFKQSYNRTVGKAFGELVKADVGREVDVDFQNPDVVVNLDLTWEKITAQINPLYVFGRYRKLVRGIPQTHWPCSDCKGRGCDACNGTGDQYPNSVESFIGKPLSELCSGGEYILHGAGREDIDALMLGSGRPFVIEIKTPKKRRFDWNEVAQLINDRAKGNVEVEELQPVVGKMVGAIKEKKAEKCYRVLVELERPVSDSELQEAIRNLVGKIEQRTPQRVAHRRADLVRKRELFEMAGKLVGDRQADIELRCSGGLYVKELISGDEGRTSPSLAERLGMTATVTKLDVMDILGDFL